MRSQVSLGALALGAVLIVAGCTAKNGSPEARAEEPIPTVEPSVRPTGTSSIGPDLTAAPGALDAIRARADTRIELPTALTDPVALGLTGPSRRVDGYVRELLEDGTVVATRDSEVGRVPTTGAWEDILQPWMIGPSAEKNGGFGELTATDDEYVWLASPDVSNDLAVFDFDIYVRETGAKPRVIGSSTPDIADEGQGRNVVPPQWRERMLVLGRHVVWTEAVRRSGSPDTPLDEPRTTALGAALNVVPLDHPGVVRELVTGWYPSVDQCAAGGQALTYLDSYEAQTPPTGRAAIRRLTLDQAGGAVSDVVVVERDEREDGRSVGGAACGDVAAISWTGPVDEQEETWWAGIEIVHDGVTTLLEDPYGGTIYHPTVTDRFVLFHVVGGDLGGSDFLFDVGSGAVHRISADTGRPDAAFLSRHHLVWPVVVPSDEEGVADAFYTLVAPVSR